MKTIKKIYLPVLALTGIFAVPACAQFYIGGGVTDSTLSPQFNSSDAPYATIISKKAKGGMLFWGYQFRRWSWLSVEEDIDMLGKVPVQFAESANYYAHSSNISVDVVSANAVGHAPITDNLASIGLVGASVAYVKDSADVGGGSLSMPLGGVFGAGFEYQFSKTWTVRAIYKKYIHVVKSCNTSVADSYEMCPYPIDVHSAQLAAMYLF